jgi:hypothetical protein
MYRVTVDGVELNIDFRHSCISGPPVTFCTVWAQTGQVPRFRCGSAYCSIRDQFCRATGRKLALTRAVADLPKHVRKAIWDGYWRATRATAEPERDGWERAARYLLEHYPEDVFPPESSTPDAKAATFARRILTWLLDPIERARLASLCGD